MSDQTIVALYDTPAHAELAVQDLLQAGVPEMAIHRHAQEGTYAGRSMAAVSRPEGGGFWSNLFGGEPDQPTEIFDRSLEAGSHAVSVKVADPLAAKVMTILESHDPVDIDDRAEAYAITQIPEARIPLAARVDAAPAPDARGGEEVFQLSEEALTVGKRAVNHGTTRIRRFVVETPVEEQVRLHDERVVVERRLVTGDRTVSGAAFADKVIEMTETAEEPMIFKTARVREEISVRRQGSERVETVRDTVRHEEVEIVKLPGDRADAGGVDTLTRKPEVYRPPHPA